jgi:outer membrane immunogenic protein
MCYGVLRLGSGGTLRKLLLGTVAFTALIAAPAMAADRGVRPIYKAPPQVWSWTGFYVGANAGGSIGVNSTTDGAVYTGTPAVNFNGDAIGTNLLYGESFRHGHTGWIFGGQVGYNWQVSPVFVLGVEADWQWSGQQDTAYVFGCGLPPARGFFLGGGPTFSTCLSDQNRLRNFGTARARGGFIVNDSLWYATGGAAWATVEDNLAFANSFNPASATTSTGFPSAFVAGTPVAGFSHTRSGWTLGAGVETRLWGGWSAKLEYLYVDLGTVTDAFTIAGNPLFGGISLAAGQGPGSTFTITTNTHFTDNIVRVGLNYRPAMAADLGVRPIYKAPPPVCRGAGSISV